MMIPALAHGTTPGSMVGRLSGPFSARITDPILSVSLVTWAVTLPLPVSGLCRKEKVSTTASPPGPTGTEGTLGVLQTGGDLGPTTQTPVCGEVTPTRSRPSTRLRHPR